jgi:DNA recombination protein RmuC
MEYVIGFIVGLLVGAGAAWFFHAQRRKAARAELETLRTQLADTFNALAAQALDANTQRLTATVGSQLDGKKALIDQSVKDIHERLNQLGKYFREVEGERKSEFGRLSSSVTSLARTTGELHQMLASSQRRGAWGERMAEDILRLAGMIEDVNYRKQSTADADEGRPDFTFLLPNDLVANMDVKFPLESYRAYLDADDDPARQTARDQLVKDVRGHVRTVASRGYIDPSGGTVPWVLVFLPSEQLFALVLEAQPDLIDEALGRSVVLTGPMTLYAMLAVIRQAAEQANLMRTADEVLQLLGTFNKQWQRFNESLDKLGSQLETAQKTFEHLRTTRSNQLTRPLEKIEDLRQQRDLPELDDEA